MKRNFMLGCTVLFCATARADVKLPAFFGDNMVLQQGVKVPVWGWADAGENVTVKFLNQTKETTSGADGAWMIKFDSLPVTESAVLQVNGKNEIKVNNVAVGEVWLASGQSNMAFTMNRASNAKEAIDASSDPQLRSFNVTRVTSETPLQDVKGTWQIAGPNTTAGFTAVGYFFARELRKKLNVPIGLIHSSWGGTPAEAWTSRPRLEAEPDFSMMIAGSDKSVETYNADLEKYKNTTLPRWETARQKAKDAGKPEPAKPRGPANPANNPKRVAVLYNAMIAPLVPFAMKGAIWYQGEANSGRAYQYRKLLPTMIADWRQKWDVQKPEDFGFYIAQLANFKAEKPEPGDSDWAELREAQTLTANMSGNGQGLAIDIGEAGDIHPKNKQDVGIRLALAAFVKTYGQKIEYSGPVYDSMKKDGNKIRLKFTHADGLMSRFSPNEKIEVSRGHWAYKAINDLSAKGIIEGRADGTYNGNKIMTRQEFAIVLAPLFKILSENFAKTNALGGHGPIAIMDKEKESKERQEVNNTLFNLRQEFLPELRKLGVPVGDLQGFAIAGADKKWKWANAKIEGSEIAVSNDEIAEPVAVRYAWADNPKATIYNAAGLPAVPFRTDDWPGITMNNK